MGICKNKGGGGESGSGEFRVKCWVSRMGEGAEEELGSEWSGWVCVYRDEGQR